MSGNDLNCIVPQWPAPSNIRAVSSVRTKGFSTSPFLSLNLGLHVGDEPNSVHRNRSKIIESIKMPSKPFWLNQTHSTHLVELEQNSKNVSENADGSYTLQQKTVCTVMTADCLPILLCSNNGDWVAAVHAGWKGLLDGIVERGVRAYFGTPVELIAWIGPAICRQCFEVGEEVVSQFVKCDSNLERFFTRKNTDKYLGDLAAVAEYKLASLGVKSYLSDLCTFENNDRFFSYRRDGKTGRMASFIWIE